MKYKITITRIFTSSSEFEVEAETPQQAKNLALEIAANHEFSRGEAEYEVDNISNTEIEIPIEVNGKYFDDRLFVGGYYWHTLNIDKQDFQSIEIHDADGNYVDEFASGFILEKPNLDDQEEITSYEVLRSEVEDYIKENLC